MVMAPPNEAVAGSWFICYVNTLQPLQDPKEIAKEAVAEIKMEFVSL